MYLVLFIFHCSFSSLGPSPSFLTFQSVTLDVVFILITVDAWAPGSAEFVGLLVISLRKILANILIIPQCYIYRVNHRVRH